MSINNYVDLPQGEGVISLNGLTGALTLVAGTGVTITPAGSTITISAPENGTVTSVGLAAPALFTVTGSPVTSAGTLTLSYSGTPLPIANGGTNATTAAAARVSLNIDQRSTFSDADYVVLSTDRYVAQVGTMSASRTVTLPAASSVNAGQSLKIVDESGTVGTTNTLTITAVGGDTIDGSVSKTIRSAYGEADLTSNGTSMWYRPVAGIGSGGTGLGTTPVNGQLLIGQTSTNSYVLNTLTAGTGVAVTNAGGSITLSTSSATATKTSNYTLTQADSLILADTSGGSFTITFPNPALSVGRVFKIKDSTGNFNTNNLTVARFGSELIEGLAASLILSANWGNYEFRTDGTNWFKTSAASNFATKTFNASGTHLVQAGITSLVATARGGSGGGGGGASGSNGSTAAAGGGGSGGSAGGSCMSRTVPLNVVPGTTYTITIGGGASAGGTASPPALNAAGAVGTAGNDAGTGGDTVFTGLWTWKGGSQGRGGKVGATFGAAGSAATAAVAQENGTTTSGAAGAAGSNAQPATGGCRSMYGAAGVVAAGGTSGAGIGGGGSGGGAGNGGDGASTSNAVATGGNGGNAGNGSNGGAAATQAGAGCGGLPGGGGGGGGIVGATGSQGGSGGAGSAGNNGYMTLVWQE